MSMVLLAAVYCVHGILPSSDAASFVSDALVAFADLVSVSFSVLINMHCYHREIIGCVDESVLNNPNLLRNQMVNLMAQPELLDRW